MTDQLPTRTERLDGPTYKIKVTLPDRTECMYLTVNHQDGKPFEIFIRTDRPELFEWITLAARYVSRDLQRGRPLTDIAAEMIDIHSEGSSMHVLLDGTQCFSLVERIGRKLAEHARGIQ